MSYYDKENTGGPINGRGILFQDCVSIFYLFKYIEDNKFISMTLETINDFTILFKHTELCVQVKDYMFTPSNVKKLLESTKIIDGKKYCFVSSTWNQDFKNIINKIDDYKNAKKAGRSFKEITTIKKNLEGCLAKHMISFEQIIDVNFDEITTQHQEETAEYSIFKWLQENSYKDIDSRQLFLRIYAKISLERPIRGSINKEIVEYLVSKCVSNEKIIVGDDKNKRSKTVHILQSLEKEKLQYTIAKDKIDLIILHIKQGSYHEAISLINELICFNHNFIKYRIWLMIQNKDYHKAKEESYLYIKNYRNDYDIFLYLGLIYYKLKKYDKSYKNFIKASNACKTGLPYELSYYLGHVCKKIHKSKEECLEYYEYCLKMDDSDYKVHYEISELKPFDQSITHLNKAIELKHTYSPAYLLKANILRGIGRIDDAYREYLKFFSLGDANINNVDALKGIYFCLVDKGRTEESIPYLVSFIDNFFYIHPNINLKEKETIVMLDCTWYGSKLLTCTRNGRNFIINSPMDSFVIPVNDKSKENTQVLIGAFPDRLLFMDEEMREKNFNETLMPMFAKTYFNDFEFLKMKNQILKLNKLSLNHKFTELIDNNNTSLLEELFPSLGESKCLIYTEYIVRDDTVTVNIFDYLYFKKVTINIGNFQIQNDFGKDNGGYFVFQSRIDNITLRACILLFCSNKSELIEISFPASNIKIQRCFK
ncbi:tetratricopeptide repeat protein [Clostridium hydrogenum]|uniref:tetratricopeptide repeat protein n=1 Tax=Clostridium hydrogenum TaxID=2855764 RepID=UPI001F16084A|nr:tetratricopeptide repeat protein [Clostridium hydrogenum]